MEGTKKAAKREPLVIKASIIAEILSLDKETIKALVTYLRHYVLIEEDREARASDVRA